jgi:hypothetical protein
LTGADWTPAAAIRNRVDTLWAAALHERGSTLTDGDLFSLLAAIGARLSEPLIGRFVRYRYYFAQRVDPSLCAELGIRPLAVTGILFCRDGLVIGERLSTATQDGGSWELVPAGGIEMCCLLPDGQVDPRLQLEKEIREEIGVEAVDAAAFEPVLAMVEGDVTDIVFRAEIALSRAQVQSGFARLPAPEHSAIDVIEPKRVGEQLKSGRRFSASTRALLEALGENK